MMKLVYRWILPASLIAAAGLVGLLVTLPHWQSGFPRGSDTLGHIARSWDVMNALQGEGLAAGLYDAVWSPGWYLGDPVRLYYPPLAAAIIGTLGYLSGDIFIGYRLFISLASMTLGIVTYLVSSRLLENRLAGLAASVMTVLGPYTLDVFYVQGSMHRVITLITLPGLAWSVEQLLTGRRLRWPLVMSGLLWAITAVAHPQQTAIYVICFILYIFLRLLTDSQVPLRRAPSPFVAMAFGAAISAPYWMPGYVGGELNGVPYSPPDYVPLYSLNWSSFLPGFWQSPGYIVIPVGMLVLGIISVLARPQPVRKAWILVSIIAILLSLGTNGPLYALLPFGSLLIPHRFLDVAATMLPLVVAGLFPLGPRWRLPRVALILGLVALDVVPALDSILPVPGDSEYTQLAESLRGYPGEGRVIHLTLPEPNARDVYYSQVVAGKNLVSGWNLNFTPNHYGIRRILSAAEFEPEYLDHLLGLWNVEYAIVRPSDAQPDFAVEPLSQAGFVPAETAGGLQLWVDETRSGPLQRLAGERMLVIGDNQTAWMTAFPWAGEGYSADLRDYNRAYLDRFRVIGLSHFEGAASETMAVVEDWVADGGTLVVDLSGFGTAYEQGYNFMGVQVVPLALSGEQSIYSNESLAWAPEQINLVDETTGGAWNGATYLGLDEVLLRIGESEDNSHLLLGYKSVGQGRVWFIGMNLLYYLSLSRDTTTRDQLVDYLLADTGVNTDIYLQPIDSSALSVNWDTAALIYTSEEPVTAVLSMTYAPRWQATLDGEPITVYNYEHLMMFDLPSGQHALNMRYDPMASGWTRAGWAISLWGLVLLAVAGWVIGLRRFGVIGQKLIGDTEGALASPDRQAQEWFTTCPNCHFKLATGGPPNSATYPFNVIRCPVCDYRLDEFGFDPGHVGGEADLRASAEAWIQSQGWSLDRLKEQFGFDRDELFEHKKVEPLPTVPPFFPSELDEDRADKPRSDKSPD